MKIVVIDGQGGSLGKTIIEQFKSSLPRYEIIAIGTNSVATSVMLKAGADHGATGENPVVVACADADIIIGPLGILAADSLLGEITPSMAQAVGKSHAKKVLIPVTKCNIMIAGVQDCAYGEYISRAIEMIKQLLN